MIYLDTSVVVPLFLPQPETDCAEAWFRELSDVPVSSDWLLVEFNSAISRKLREGTLRPARANALRRAFEEFADGGIRLLPISRDTCRDAAELVSAHSTGLRSGDALHLAAAREVGADIVATYDAIVGRNAKRLGLKPLAPNAI